MSCKKPVCLTLKEKAEILDFLQKGSSVTCLAKKYNVAKSTICGIKKKEKIILKSVNNTFSGPGKRKTLRTSELPKMEKALYRWFIRMRDKNWPVSALMLKEKAKTLHSKLKEHDGGFHASDGWLQGFKKRYGVRLLQVSGEKLSSQPQLVDPSNDESNDDDYISEAREKIKPSEAIQIFNKAVQWASHEGVDQRDMNVLKRLREKAVIQFIEKQKTQKKMTDFFK